MLGKCSDGEVDHDGDIVSPQWLAGAVKAFLAGFPAIRLQHRSDYPIGKGLQSWQDPDGSTWLKALIVDEKAQRMVRKGVLRAWSVGIADPQQRRSNKCPRYFIDGGSLREVSLVDAPANERCGITVVSKSAGGYVGKAFTAKGLRKAAELADARDRALTEVLGISNPTIREYAYEALGERYGTG